ncbi:MAG: VWA domain-containing protein [Thermoanaerobaculia bacterium]|nr:VWA domain-containing protein [Thermoanaerobaculia bacterium]
MRFSQRPSANLIFIVLLSASWLTWSRSGPAQDEGQSGAEPAAAEGFFEAVDVEIVNIDVWVTDKSGRHVPGLTRDDFQIYRDGDPVGTTNFYAVENGRPAETVQPVERQLAEDGEAPSSEREGLRSPLAPEHRLRLVVFVDNFNSAPLERNRVLPALRQFLGNTVRHGDEVMLVSFDRSLRVRQPFTRSTDLVFAQLDELYDDAGFVPARRRQQMETLRRIDTSREGSYALGLALTYAESEMHDVEATADAMRELIETIAGMPGRKALLHVSSGVPMAAGEEMFHAVAEKFDDGRAYSEIGRHDTSRAFERVARHANAHRVVFYTLDAGGNRGMHYANAEYGGFVSPNLRRTLDSVVPENLQSTLRLLAQETGGRAIVNRNEVLPGLEEVASDLRTFYSLGIANANVDHGRYHQIKVELVDRDLRKKYQVRHRRGYRPRSQDSRMVDGLRSSLLYGFEENPIGFTAVWGRPVPHDREDHYLLPVQLSIPLRDLVLLPVAGGKYELRLKLYVGVADERGDLSEIDRVPLGLRIEEQHLEAAQGESFLYTHQLIPDRGRRKVGLTVLDLVGGKTSIVTRAVRVGTETSGS